MPFAPRVALFLLASPLFALAVASGCSSSGEGTSSSSSSNTSQSTGSASTGTESTGSAGNGGNGGNGGAGGATTGSGGTGGATTGTGGSGGSSLVACQGKYYQCGDGVDNDGDGKIDANDPDCLGPCDNTENNFYGGIPGQAGPSCTVDCYFDQDSGSGNDDCHWNHQCDPLSVAPNYYPEKSNGSKCAYDKNANTPGTGSSCTELSQMQTQACLNFCKPLVPNGCDCFGCCELPAGSGKHVWLGSEDANGNGSCSLKDLANPDKCQPCTPVPGCYNTCGHCELCIGKDTLPPDCNSGSSSSSSTGAGTGGSGSTTSSSSTGSGAGGGGSEQCEAGVQPCGLPGQALCPGGYYCITGCCIQVPK